MTKEKFIIKKLYHIELAIQCLMKNKQLDMYSDMKERADMEERVNETLENEL